MLIYRFKFLFWIAARLGLYALVLKKHICFVILYSSSVWFSSCLFKTPPPEYPVCSDWSAQTRPSWHR